MTADTTRAAGRPAQASSSTGQPSGADAAPPARRPLRLVLVLAAAAVIGLLIWRAVAPSPVSDAIVALSGRIEGDEAIVASKLAGRVLEVRVHEGDEVKANDVLAVLDDDQVRAREDQARAALAQVEARARAAGDQIAVLQEQLRQTQLQTEQARVDSGARVRQAEADLAAAQAQLSQQKASYQLALFDKDAYERLARNGAVAERQAKVAVSTAEQQAAAVEAAQRRVDAAQATVATANAALTTPDIRAADSARVRRQLVQQEAEVAGMAAQTAQARAQLAEAEANRGDLTIRAPFDGTIVTRAAEPGEIVGAGTAIATLVDLSRVYLRGFVPEGRIGAVKVGQPARVYLDSNPNAPIEAAVSRVDPQAMFTPENTYFRDDRVKQVVGVKVQLKGGTGFAKPGMPADGEILIAEGAWPKEGRHE